MSKNRDVICKSRKQKKIHTTNSKTEEKLCCPPTMFWYDNTHNDYPKVWGCKQCSICLLNEAEVVKHLKNCTKVPHVPPPIPTEKYEVSYKCEICNKNFNRRARLNTHLKDKKNHRFT